MATIIVLVTVSVVIILGVLNNHFNRRVESEFKKKLQAQRGQVEILINKRIEAIRNVLNDLGSDNTIRVTMMLGAEEQLALRITQTYPAADGAYHFVQKYGDKSIFPGQYPGLSPEFIALVIQKLPYGEVVAEQEKTGLFWIFISPIMNVDRRMGTVYALYDLVEDKKLIRSIEQTVEGEIVLIQSKATLSLSSGVMLPIDVSGRSPFLEDSGFVPAGKNFALSKITGVDNLFFLSSLESLNKDKRKVTLMMGLFSALVLVVSMFIAIFIARRMISPLREMTRKATQISEGQKELRFDGGGNYWEFDQLSQAFNYMLAHLKDAEERSRYKELLENVDDAVYIIDQDAKILDANTAAYSQLGYPPAAFFKLELADILSEEANAKIIAQLNETAQNTASSELSLETVHRKKDDSTIPVEIHSRVITYRSKKVILNVARDISRRIEAEKEKKQLEAQLIHAQKMEAIGTLAGGVAHDFNNLLMGIQGRLSMIRMDSDSEQPHYRHLDHIEKTIMSAAGLTRQLLGFARKGKYEIRPTRISTLLEDSTRMFIRTRKEIDLQLDCQKDVWTVNADRGQIEQVLINLYVNAWQAMPEGGDLTVCAENTSLDDEFCRAYEAEPGDYVKISVTDTGIGMAPETIARIFEPFFTTKGVGKGTGLGLASAYGIIKKHQGIIQVESEIGVGTTFSIFLPASPAEKVDTPTGKKAPIKGRGTILIVDDEEESIMAEELMLKELGYKVIQARSGRDAIRICREHTDQLDLITLDMIMPGMSGKETFDRLREINPDIKVLLVSGYSRNRQVEELMQRGCSGYLQKPFDLHDLSSKIIEVMAR
jgi:PAS domain S-box-containing protein